ncbi:hypothetical protein [Microseira wollei]|uniref:Uncharacterized protein n=1 Tax=Microseira wollei NIES-4236 TaxID=2530354 RepID=A0AAV3X1X2_9CYAN|nr:hypothetical protein [Microseira wollei]GET36019.1 hypothetical protein MiSe_07670 [Microseira wollei NIES-4236]
MPAALSFYYPADEEYQAERFGDVSLRNAAPFIEVYKSQKLNSNELSFDLLVNSFENVVKHKIAMLLAPRLHKRSRGAT